MSTIAYNYNSVSIADTIDNQMITFSNKLTTDSKQLATILVINGLTASMIANMITTSKI